MREAARELIQRQLELCRPWMTRLEKRHGIEDLYQEMWAQCLTWRKVDWRIRQYRRIRCAAMRLVLSELERRYLQQTVRFSDLPEEDRAPSRPHWQIPGPCEEVERSDLLAFIEQRLARLDRHQRGSVELSFYEAKPDRVIAAGFGVAAHRVRRWRNQALRKIRSQVSEC